MCLRLRRMWFRPWSSVQLAAGSIGRMHRDIRESVSLVLVPPLLSSPAQSTSRRACASGCACCFSRTNCIVPSCLPKDFRVVPADHVSCTVLYSICSLIPDALKVLPSNRRRRSSLFPSSSLFASRFGLAHLRSLLSHRLAAESTSLPSPCPKRAQLSPQSLT